MIVRVTLVCATMVISACGSSNPQVVTPNATEMMAQAATGIAYVATIDALTATPLPTPAPTEDAVTATVAVPTAVATLMPVINPTTTMAPVIVSAILSPSVTMAASMTATPTPQATESAGVTETPLVPTVTLTPELMETVTATSTATPVPTFVPTPTAAYIDYTVVSGDNLLSIAIRYHVSMATLMVQNNLSDAAWINAGQVLKIPNVPSSTDASAFWTVYIVQPGQSLSEIALQNDVALDELVKVNRIADAAAIQIGQMLILPVDSPGAVAKAVQPSPPDKPIAAAPVARSLAAVPAPKAAPPASVQIQAANVTGAEAMIASLLAAYNQARAAYGVAALTLAAPLLQSAQLHAQDCAARGYGSHVGSDGATTHQRVVRAGYVGRITGENWAWARTPAGAFDMWFNQESDVGPHRANILSVRYTHVGFGIAAANGGFYFIADFGAP